MPRGGARPNSGGPREGAGRPDKRRVQFKTYLDGNVRAALDLAYDDWHTENQGKSLADFVNLVLSESERLKGFGV